MAHFAKLDNDNKVTQVIVVNNEDLLDENGRESEDVGVEFLTRLYGHHAWKKTSYNGKFRKHYAGVGYTYDSKTDSFIPPQPYPSWSLNVETAEWEAPTPCPDDGVERKWDEDNKTWRSLDQFI